MAVLANGDIYEIGDTVYWLNFEGLLKCGAIYAIKGDKVYVKVSEGRRLTNYRVSIAECRHTEQELHRDVSYVLKNDKAYKKVNTNGRTTYHRMSVSKYRQMEQDCRMIIV